jgi:hypothetical protein
MTGDEILEQIQEILTERGWKAGASSDKEMAGSGPVCLVDAASIAMQGTPQEHRDWMQVRDALQQAAGIQRRDQATGKIGAMISHWNDEPGRTELEVLNVVGRARAVLAGEFS